MKTLEPLKISEIASYFDVTSQTVYRWIDRYNIVTLEYNGVKHVTPDEFTKLKEKVKDVKGKNDPSLPLESVKASEDIKVLEERNKALEREIGRLEEIIASLEEDKQAQQEQIGLLLDMNRQQLKMLEAPKQKSLGQRIKEFFIGSE